MTTIRTRFAPSPTGSLHVGSVRTALYSYLYARRYQGVFILRIEDTDVERSTLESVQGILDGMHWLGLNYDEGPFFQAQRFDRYRKVAAELLHAGKAYRCYCSKERLEQLRNTQMANKEKPRYDGHCRHLNHPSTDQPFVIRFANPESGEVIFDDAVHGRTVFQNKELDDLIILRSDNTPTYNFTVVIDDWDMKITHVIRGDDHLNNTPRQINILTALGAALPVYAHIPMILGPDGKKLSKRHGAVNVTQYREEGFLPHALLNYLVRLGWSHGDQEIFSAEEMIALFDIDHLNKSAAAFDPEKLRWLNQHYLKTMDPDDVAPEFIWQLKHLNIDYIHGPSLKEIILIQRERCKTLTEMAERSRFFFESIKPNDALLQKHVTPEVKPAIKKLHDELKQLDHWTDENIHNILQQLTVEYAISLGALAQAVRVLITGGTVSPPLNSTLRVLGKTKTLHALTIG